MILTNNKQWNVKLQKILISEFASSLILSPASEKVGGNLLFVKLSFVLATALVRLRSVPRCQTISTRWGGKARTSRRTPHTRWVPKLLSPDHF